MEYLGIIYVAWCSVTKLSYIGQSRSSIIEKIRKKYNTHEKIRDKRWKEHINDQNNDEYFHKAIKKYGASSFKFIIYKTFEADTYKKITELVNECEIDTIVKFNTKAPNGYNLQSGGNSSILHEDTRKKISESQKKRMTIEMKQHLRNMNIGKKQSAETLEKKRLSRIGVPWSDSKRKSMIGRKNTEATKQKMSISQKGRVFSDITKQRMSESKQKIRKLTDEDVIKILKNEEKHNQKQLAEKYNVSKQLINNIVNFKRGYEKFRLK